MATAQGASSSPFARVARAHGASTSSASRNSTPSPLSNAIPRLRAADTPEFPCVNSRNRGSENRRTTSPVPSVEPSSTTTMDQSVWVCRRTDRIVSPIKAAQFQAGVRILMCKGDTGARDVWLDLIVPGYGNPVNATGGHDGIAKGRGPPTALLPRSVSKKINRRRLFSHKGSSHPDIDAHRASRIHPIVRRHRHTHPAPGGAGRRRSVADLAAWRPAGPHSRPFSAGRHQLRPGRGASLQRDDRTRRDCRSRLPARTRSHVPDGVDAAGGVRATVGDRRRDHPADGPVHAHHGLAPSRRDRFRRFAG